MPRIKLSPGMQQAANKQPEAGMGFHIVRVLFTDGRILPHTNLYNGEELEVPLGYEDATISAIQFVPR